MKKKITPFRNPYSVVITFIFYCCMFGIGPLQAQQLKPIPVELSFHNASLIDVFEQLEGLAHMPISYDKNQFIHAKRINAEFSGTSLDQVLKHVLEGTGQDYQLINNSIVIAKRAVNSSEKQELAMLKGRVVEFETSSPLANATLQLVELKRTVKSNAAGFYEFVDVPAGRYTLLVSYVAYKSETLHVTVRAGREASYDIRLQSDDTSLEEVRVIARTRRPVSHSSERQVLDEVRSASLVMSAISSEQISRSADRNAADVMQRVAGVTTVDDQFVVVRGLNERYNLTYLNDNVAPSTEMFSRAFALDLIPSRIIDKVFVYKSPSPENQADATGGVIKIFTKDARMVKHFDIEVQGGWETGTTFKDGFLTYEGGRFDFLGFDDGTRKLPGSIPGFGNFDQVDVSQETYLNAFSHILTYGQKTALPNLQITANYYDSFPLLGRQLSMLTSLNYKNDRQYAHFTRQDGITYMDNVNFETSSRDNAQLNLLQNFTYRLRDSSNVQFKNFILNQGQSSTIVRISRPYAFDDSRQLETIDKNNILTYFSRFLYAGNLGGQHYYQQAKHKFLWNLGYTFSQQATPDERVIRLQAPVPWMEMGDASMHWTARIRQGDKDETDQTSVTNGIMSRFWSRMQEGVYNVSADYHYNLRPWLKFQTGTFHQFKQRKIYRRIYTIHEGDFKGGDASDVSTPAGYYGKYVNPNLVSFKENSLDRVWSSYYFRPDETGLKVFDRTSGADAYIGTEQNNSGYAMLALTPLDRKIEVTGGLRVEYNRQKIAASIPKNSPFSVNYPIFIDNPTLHYLPSINMSFRPSNSWVFRAGYGRTLNRYEFREASPYEETDYQNYQVIRGNQNLKTASVENYDLRLEFYPAANARGELISVGAFYKDLTNPIERIHINNRVLDILPMITFQNAGRATIKGIELELQKKMDFLPGKFFRELSLIGNASFIRSEAIKDSLDLKQELEEFGRNLRLTTVKRPLQGQAPYIYNVGLNYDNPGFGSKVSLNYNIIGLRIYAAGTYEKYNKLLATTEFRGSLMELPRKSLDFAYTQRVFQHMQLKLSVQNLLNQPIEMAIDNNYTWKYEPQYEITDPDPMTNITKGGDNIASSFNPGRHFILTFSYSL